MSEPTGRERVMADAAARGIHVDFEERGPAGSLEQAAAALGIPAASIVKTIVVKKHDGSFLFALVPGDRQISWSKLRPIVGVNKLRMPEASVALEATGYERGTIVPLGSTTAWPVYADERINGRIALGAGEHGVSAFVDAEQLIAGLSATVADITDGRRRAPEGSDLVGVQAAVDDRRLVVIRNLAEVAIADSRRGVAH